MMALELRGGIDPSNLHLKKELTQIRKAARVLRDPGTTSSWRSPLNSARSLQQSHHYAHHYKNGHNDSLDGNSIDTSSQPFFQVEHGSNANSHSGGRTNGNGNVNGKEKERKVFLYNWRSQKSESERSRQVDEDDGENGKDEGSSSTQDVDSLSDARNNGRANDSKSDTCLSDRYGSTIFRCKETNFTPSIRRTIKKKSRRSVHSSASLRHHNERLQKQFLMGRNGKKGGEHLPGLALRRDELLSLADQSDGTEEYFNSDDLRRASAISPLLARLKNKRWAKPSTKLLRKDDDSVSHSTPALSTHSYHKYRTRNHSTVESWDGTTASFNDADDEVDNQLDLPGRHGCGIPCYWSRRSTPKSRGGGYTSGCSPSLSDTLRRSIFCGGQSQTLYQGKQRLLSSNKRRDLVPLLGNSGDGRGGSYLGSSDDELSTNYGELDLEAVSRLDGRRWSSSCRSQEGLDLGEEGSPENIRSLSQKYRPMFFEDLVGQNMVIQSLISSLSRGRISPLHLFQGPRGTGKTSTAKIFAASLNCLANEDTKPCGVCRECTDYISGKSSNLQEVDGSNKKGIDKVKYLLRNMSVVPLPANSQYKVFVVDECHLLPSKTWLAFLRFLEKPMQRVVFILITTDVDNVPRTILSRCQKHVFSKIGNGDIVARLRKIASDESLDVESEALDLIALNADGSLRDAETMLDQLSLLGKRITPSLVNELVGVVSDEKLLDLLELALSSNATETVIRARELMDSGVDPIVLMSQMATLIVDIIAGTYPSHNDSFFGGRSLSERELDKLKHALTLLSEAEKHLRVSSERSTWFTATLLQLGSVPSPERSHSGSSRRQSTKMTEEDGINILKDAIMQKQRSLFGTRKSSSPSFFQKSAQRKSTSLEDDDVTSQENTSRSKQSDILAEIWIQCIEKCHSKTLRQLLRSHGKLVSITEVNGGVVAHLSFEDDNIRTRAEGFLSSITNSFELVLRRNVEVKIITVPDSPHLKPMDTAVTNNGSSDLDSLQDLHKFPKGSFHESEGNAQMSKPGLPVQRIESIIREQRLETAWLQAMEKGTPGSINCLKPERNQVLPQDSIYHQNELDSFKSEDLPLQQWEDELNHEMKALKIRSGVAVEKDQVVKRADHCPISPSLLHNSSFSKDNMGYESGTGGPGCSSLFCWNNARPPRRGKCAQGKPVRGRSKSRFSWFGECARSTESRTPTTKYQR